MKESPSNHKKRKQQNSPQGKNHKLQNGFQSDNNQQQLPIYTARRKFIEEIKKASSCIVIGETASGKTTQIPQYLLKSGVSEHGMIACTQPRRVAAITIAERVSNEMNSELGQKVGYCVRFEDCTSDQTKIKYMTDGMLLREAIGDKLLKKYSIVILDEAHERTIHTDVLFGIVKNAQRQRKLLNLSDLKLIVMSATMDVDHFSQYFNNAPVLYIEGRLHPIKIQYTATTQSDYILAALITIFQIHKEAAAKDDILVFLTGQEEIESMMQTMKEISLSLSPDLPKLVLCPLYASLPHHQQLKAFRQTPSGCRKVVLSTNIAETSVTIRGIKYVIDPGKVKAKSFHPKTGLDLLSIRPISQAQAWQRAGRAGRERPGVVYRLYTEEDFYKLEVNTVPEIQRCNVSNVILQLLAIGIDNIRTFDFIDAPFSEALDKAFDELALLGAVTENGNGLFKLTSLGRKMAVFPLEPKLAKAIILSVDYNCVEEILSLVAMLSVESVKYSPHSKREEATSRHLKFTSSEGDFIMLLNIYRAFKQNKGNKNWCIDNYINHRNMSTVMDIRKQLRDLCLKASIVITSSQRDITSLRKCIAAALFSNSAELQMDGTYRAIASSEIVHIHPSSCLFQSKPAYVVYKELIHTSKCFMRDLCVVDPDWFYNAAPDYFHKKLKGRR